MAQGDDSAHSDRFLQLLDSLKAQYQHEVGGLRQEVARLQATHGLNGDEQLMGPSPTSRSRCTQAATDHLRLRSQWTAAGRMDSDAAIDVSGMDFDEDDKQMVETSEGLFLQDGVPPWKRALLNPNTTWRNYWALVGLGMVFYDMISVPLQAFNIPYNVFFAGMDWVTLLFWTADMANSFYCGYFEGGELVLSIRKTIWKYLRTWFCVDMLVVGPDWFQMIVVGQDSKGSSNSMNKLLRGARAIRILRLLRIMKLQRIISKLYDMIDNEYSFILAELMKMMLCILVVNHFIACGWFFVGNYSATHGLTSWTTWNERFDEQSIGYQYTTALHWTLTQFTPASMDVVARNIVERVFSIGVLLFAMVAFSSIVGTVTTSMTVIRQMNDDKQKQFWKLRRYLKQRNVSSDLQQRMLRFIEYQISKQEKTIQTGTVLLLQRISEQLNSEFSHEVHSPFLLGHAFYKVLSKDMKGIAFRLCHLAIKAQQIASYDMMFTAGEEAETAFVLKSGSLRYITHAGTPLDPPIREKEWFAEAVLWAPWRYQGSCRGAAPSEILALNAKSFAQALSNHPKSFEYACRYGERFVRFLNIGRESARTDVVRNEEFFRAAVADNHDCEERLLAMEEAATQMLEPSLLAVGKEVEEQEEVLKPEHVVMFNEEVEQEDDEEDEEEKGKADAQGMEQEKVPPSNGHSSGRADVQLQTEPDMQMELMPNGNGVHHRASHSSSGKQKRIVPFQTARTWVSSTLVRPCFTPCVPGAGTD